MSGSIFDPMWCTTTKPVFDRSALTIGNAYIVTSISEDNAVHCILKSFTETMLTFIMYSPMTEDITEITVTINNIMNGDNTVKALYC